MMMESVEPKPTRGPQIGAEGPGSAWLILVASCLLIAAVVLAWMDALRIANAARQLALVGELQLAARDLGALATRAGGGDRPALQQLRERTEAMRSALATLADGGMHDGRTIAPAAGDLQTRLRELSGQWAEFRRRTDALPAVAPPEPKAAKDTKRGADRTAPAAAAQKAATRGGRSPEASAIAVSLLNVESSFIAPLESIGSEVRARTAQAPWLSYLAAACAAAALMTLAALFASIRRGAAAMRKAAAETKSAVLDGLRPALRTLRIDASDDALADPGAFGHRLSTEILAVIDGIKVLVKALDSATAEADKFAVVGHLAAQALGTAEERAARTGSDLQAAARRVAAVCASLSAGAKDVQQESQKVLVVVGAAATTLKSAERSAERLREDMQAITGSYARTVANNKEIEQGLTEIADRLTQGEGFALRAADRLPGAGADEAVSFARDVRASLGSSLLMLKQSIALVQRTGREADDLSGALARAAAAAGQPSRAAIEAAHALGEVERVLAELCARISSMSRIASAAEVSQLVSSLEEIVRQLSQSSASARQVIDATKSAATHIEDLARLLNSMKPYRS